MHCVKCGCEMRRLMRESFMQRRVYPYFGYFPWECPLCRELTMYKVRHLKRRKSRRDEAGVDELEVPGKSNRNSSGISAVKAG